MHKASWAMWISLALAACGGDGGGSSGLPDNKSAGSLTSAEAMALCQEIAADYPERTIDCGNGTTITIGTSASDCATATIPATCTATVGDFRDCFAAMDALTDAQVCMSDGFPPECAPVFTQTCIGGS